MRRMCRVNDVVFATEDYDMNAWYMSGAGNDFMVIDARGISLDFSRIAQELCKKMECDGFMAVDHSNIVLQLKLLHSMKLNSLNLENTKNRLLRTLKLLPEH